VVFVFWKKIMWFLFLEPTIHRIIFLSPASQAGRSTKVLFKFQYTAEHPTTFSYNILAELIKINLKAQQLELAPKMKKKNYFFWFSQIFAN
jgi:hypothetical protein